jgi:hypothetical protein
VLITTVEMWPPPFCVSVSTDSSNVMMSNPLCRNAALAISGSMLVFNQLSAAASLSAFVQFGMFAGQSCALFCWFGMMNE